MNRNNHNAADAMILRLFFALLCLKPVVVFGQRVDVELPHLIDLDSDGRKEIVFIDKNTGDSNYLVVTDSNGIPRPGFPIDLQTLACGEISDAGMMVTDLAGDGNQEIVVRVKGTFNKLFDKLFAFRHDGSTLPPWPKTGIIVPPGGNRTGIIAPMLTRINGVPHIFINSEGEFWDSVGPIEYLHVFGPDGTQKATTSFQWSFGPFQSFGSGLYYGAAASDLNRDGIDEIVLIRDSAIHILDSLSLARIARKPSPVPNPSDLRGDVFGFPSLADVNRDGYDDIFLKDLRPTPNYTKNTCGGEGVPNMAIPAFDMRGIEMGLR